MLLLLAALTASARQLVEVGAVASCTELAVVESDGRRLDLPADAAEELSCPTLAGLSPDGQLLVYQHGDAVKATDFRRSWTLAELPAGSEGTSALAWAPGGAHLAFVNVFQGHYPTGTAVFVVALGPPPRVQVLPLKVAFTCGSTCGAAAGDLAFEGARTLRYRTWAEAPYDLEGEAAFQRVSVAVP